MNYNLAYGLFRTRSKSITDSTDATDFIFHGSLLPLDLLRISLRLYGAGFLQLMKIRQNPSARQAHTIRDNKIKISERTDPSHPLSVLFFERLWLSRSDEHKRYDIWYCLPDSRSLCGYNPETSSRVTLASLGTVFQTGLGAWLFVVWLFCYLVDCRKSTTASARFFTFH